MEFVYLKSPFGDIEESENKAIIIKQNDLIFFGFPYIENKLAKYKKTIKIAECSSSIGNSMLANKYNFDYIIVNANNNILKKLNSLAKQRKFFKDTTTLIQHLNGENI